MPVADAAAIFQSLACEPLIALAVSGGSDSLSLLHLAAEQLCPRRCVALTVDHGLREESAYEAIQVANWCAALGVAHHALKWTGPKPSTGIQAKARIARYDLLAAKCHALGIPVLLTGHTRDDQAETVAMRKMRTDSVRSLAAIWPETNWKGLRVVRPLLGEEREALRKTLRTRGVNWIDDPSNENTSFERVRVRQALTGQDHAALAGEAQRALETVLAHQDAARDWLRKDAVIHPSGLVRLSREGLRRLHPDAALEALETVIRMVGSGKAPERAAVIAAVRLAQGDHAGRLTVAGALLACRRREVLVGREPGRVDAGRQTVPMSGQLLWDGRFVVTAPQGALVRPAGNKCPKSDPALPAFVLAGLPQIEFSDGTTAIPHLQAHPNSGVSLSERFVL